MKAIITGGSGFLGSKLSEKLIEKGYDVVSLDIVPPRNPLVKFLKVDISKEIPKSDLILSPDVVINLSGANIGKKWNEEYKKSIYDSRILGTKNLVSFISSLENKPKAFISASAVGVYGDREDEILDESSEIKENQGFLAKVAKDWENEAKNAEKSGIRTVILRQGHILGMGGLIQTLLPYYKIGLGGPIGSGKQYFPWIHMEDLVNLYIYSIENTQISGAVNAVAGEPLNNKTFSKIFASVLKRLHIFFIPVFILKITYGEFAEEIVKSQRVISKKIDKNFFKFSNLKDALKNIFQK